MTEVARVCKCVSSAYPGSSKFSFSASLVRRDTFVSCDRENKSRSHWFSIILPEMSLDAFSKSSKC